MTDKIEELILSHAQFTGKESNTGYRTLKCPICNDYKARAGFQFNPDDVRYSCFNCGHKAGYMYDSGSMYPKFRQVMLALGVQDTDLNHVLARQFLEEDLSIFKKKPVKKAPGIIIPKPIPIPAEWYPVKSAINEWGEAARLWLQHIRGIDPESYPFYLSTEKHDVGRLIIPFFRKDQLIFWQSRAFDDKDKKRYLSSSVSKDGVFFNYDELERWDTKLPLFVTEGAFKALPINGVALAGSTLPAEKIAMLKKVAERREVIFVLDCHDPQQNGYKLGKAALAAGFTITYLNLDGYDDVDSAVKQFGKLFVMSLLLENKKTGLDAQMALEMYVK